MNLVGLGIYHGTQLSEDTIGNQKRRIGRNYDQLQPIFAYRDINSLIPLDNTVIPKTKAHGARGLTNLILDRSWHLFEQNLPANLPYN